MRFPRGFPRGVPHGSVSRSRHSPTPTKTQATILKVTPAGESHALVVTALLATPATIPPSPNTIRPTPPITGDAHAGFGTSSPTGDPSS